MATTRSFELEDLFKFNNINLDVLTETYNTNFYYTYLATWPEYFKVIEAPSGRLMSYVMGKSEGKRELWHGHVTAVTVAPEYRRLGLAKQLMQGLEDTSERVYNVSLTSFTGLPTSYPSSNSSSFTLLNAPHIPRHTSWISSFGSRTRWPLACIVSLGECIRHLGILRDHFCLLPYLYARNCAVRYETYRQVIEYYAGEEDALDMRKALPRDPDKKSMVPLKHPVYPSQLEW